MRYVISVAVVALTVGAAAWLVRKLWKRFEQYELHPVTLSGKLKLAGFTFSMWIVVCSLIILGLSTSALGWQVLSIWLVKGILVLAAILTFLTFGTFRKRKAGR